MREALRSLKRELVLSRLEQYNWDVVAARESLRLSRTTFNRYLEELGIDAGGKTRRSSLAD
jgi:DNA-binding NtrC family response regulator